MTIKKKKKSLNDIVESESKKHDSFNNKSVFHFFVHYIKKKKKSINTYFLKSFNPFFLFFKTEALVLSAALYTQKQTI